MKEGKKGRFSFLRFDRVDLEALTLVMPFQAAD